jgi:hypothetical protein
MITDREGILAIIAILFMTFALLLLINKAGHLAQTLIEAGILP